MEKFNSLEACQEEYPEDDYLVLSDDQANDWAQEYIEDSLWAFNPSFLESYVSCNEATIRKLQELCEDANPALLDLVGESLLHLVADAIGCDGRGHFLSPYDGKEREVEIDGEIWFVYRQN